MTVVMEVEVVDAVDPEEDNRSSSGGKDLVQEETAKIAAAAVNGFVRSCCRWIVETKSHLTVFAFLFCWNIFQGLQCMELVKEWENGD